MFSWLDLIMPIGTGLIAGTLGVIGLIKGKTLPARLISLATGLAFIATIPMLYTVRASGTKPNYTTSHGIGVVQGKVNTCPKEKIEAWTDWAIGFWSKHYDPVKVRQSVRDKLLVCVDSPKLTTWGRIVKGYSHGKFSVIGTLNTESLFYHEISHQIVDRFVPYSETAHHSLFKEKQLGH